MKKRANLGIGYQQSQTSTQKSFTDSETTRKIEQIAKKKGIWGLGAKTKITRTGNSLAIRIPKKLIDHLGLKEGDETYIHPDNNRLIMDNIVEYKK